MTYEKPWSSYETQLDLLVSRGMLVTDRSRALDYLKRIGYYRLSGYWFSFRERSEPCCPLVPGSVEKLRKARVDRLALDSFKPGTSFQHAVDLYVFDKKLRLLALDALERIEIALRVDIAHTLGEKDCFAYLNPDLFFPGFSKTLDKNSGLTKHHEWLTKHAGLIGRSKEEFIRHNRDRYGLPLAIWVVCEIWDFGTLSTLFAGMRETDQDVIAGKYGISNGRLFASWLRSLNYLRNVCAHHSRLWNRNIIDQPKLPTASDLPWTAPFIGNPHRLARPFLLFCIAQHLLNRINPASSWSTRFQALLAEFPAQASLSLESMGKPQEDWNATLWREKLVQ